MWIYLHTAVYWIQRDSPLAQLLQVASAERHVHLQDFDAVVEPHEHRLFLTGAVRRSSRWSSALLCRSAPIWAAAFIIETAPCSWTLTLRALLEPRSGIRRWPLIHKSGYGLVCCVYGSWNVIVKADLIFSSLCSRWRGPVFCWTRSDGQRSLWGTRWQTHTSAQWAASLWRSPAGADLRSDWVRDLEGEWRDSLWVLDGVMMVGFGFLVWRRSGEEHAAEGTPEARLCGTGAELLLICFRLQVPPEDWSGSSQTAAWRSAPTSGVVWTGASPAASESVAVVSSVMLVVSVITMTSSWSAAAVTGLSGEHAG